MSNPEPPRSGRSCARRLRGLTLIECAIVCAVIGLMAAVALPTYRSSGLRTARLDAVQALMRVQVAQETYRAHSGLYAPDLTTLRLTSLSSQSRYALALAVTGPDSYRASATARGSQADDSACGVLTLAIADGFVESGPSPQCWNR